MLILLCFMVLVHVSFGYKITSFSKVISLTQRLASSKQMTVVKVHDVIECARQCVHSQICGSFVFSSGNHSCQTFNNAVQVRFLEESTSFFGISGYSKHYWCPAGYSYVDSTDGCLKVGQIKVSILQAETACGDDGALLLNLQTAVKHSAVRSYLQEKGLENLDYWLGGSDTKEEGVWRWSDGSLVTDINWCKGETNGGSGENFMEMKKSFNCTNDADQRYRIYYICELQTVRVP